MTSTLSILFIVSFISLFVIATLSEIDVLPDWFKHALVWAVWLLALPFALAVYAGLQLGQEIDRRVRK